jgi:uncharacterized protein (TIGR03437 family)
VFSVHLGWQPGRLGRCGGLPWPKFTALARLRYHEEGIQNVTRLIRAFSILLCAEVFGGSSRAQPIPGSLTSYPVPIGGQPNSVYFDSSGDVYFGSSAIAGATPGAAQTQTGGGTCGTGITFGITYSIPCRDAFIGKVDAGGHAVFATLLGGPTNDIATAVVADASGSVYITGTTGGQFPTTPNAAITVAGPAFAAKLSADGTTFLYVTYLPRTFSNAYAIGVDGQGNAYIAGATASYQPEVVKVSADGSAILYTTILGPPAPQSDSGEGITVDYAGNVLVAGATTSPNFPVTAGVLQTQLTGTENAFLTKLDPNGNTLFSTYLGGSGSDFATTAKTDPQGNVYLAGRTLSLDFPTTAGSFEPTVQIPLWTNVPEGFVAKIAPDASHLLYSTYFPIATVVPGSSGDTYIAGFTRDLFPVTPSAPQPCSGGGPAVVVAHLDANGALLDASYTNEQYAQIALASDGSILVGGQTTFSRLVFGSQGWTAPSCLSPQTLDWATLYATGGGVAPGQFITLTGLGIGPSAGVSYQPDGQGNVPMTLGGVQVLFDGEAAPMLYVQSEQVNTQVPFDLAGKSSTQMTIQYNGTIFGPMMLYIEPPIPGLLRLQPGVTAQAAALNEDGTINGPSNPAPRGSVIALWGEGFGATDPACATGGLNVDYAASLSGQPLVMIDFEQTASSNATYQKVQYAGSAPGLLCGITQINVQIPAAAPPGARALTPWVANSEGTPALSIVYVK